MSNFMIILPSWTTKFVTHDKENPRSFYQPNASQKEDILYTAGVAAPEASQNMHLCATFGFAVSRNTFAFLNWFRSCAICVLHLLARNAFTCSKSRSLHQSVHPTCLCTFHSCPILGTTQGSTAVVFPLPPKIT